MTKLNPFKVLGLATNAEPEVIRAAYRALARKYHPDAANGNAAELNERMAEINWAAEELAKNPASWRDQEFTGFESDIASKCPSCQRSFTVDRPGNVRCSQCKWEFRIDGSGNVVDGVPIRTECPGCEHRFTARTDGELDCPSCEWQFEITNAGQVIDGMPISSCCPACNTDVFVNWPGSLSCPGCSTGFVIDRSGKVLSRSR